VKALAGLSKRAQTALLRFLVGLGPLDEITGDGLVKEVLEFCASDGAEAPADYHGPLLRLLAASRPVDTMSAERLVLEVWDRVHDHRTRNLGPKEIDRITDVVSLGPTFDDVLARLLEGPLTNRMTTMMKEVEARMASADRGNGETPRHSEESGPVDRAAA
jgi:hypothetical protein